MKNEINKKMKNRQKHTHKQYRDEAGKLAVAIPTVLVYGSQNCCTCVCESHEICHLFEKMFSSTKNSMLYSMLK